MPQKKLVLLLNANQEYIRHLQEEDVKKYAPEINRLFEAVTDTYMPLLWMFEKLEEDMIPFRIQMVLPPVLCTLLEDTVVQAQYVEWLTRAELFCTKEVKRVSKNKKVQDLAQKRLEHIQKCRADFTERYGMRLVPQFAEHQKNGCLEIMATTGTSLFMPFYKEMKEILSAQVETGLLAYKHFFGEIPDGFWLPDLGYAEGVESIVRAYGINYTVLDPRSTMLAKELPEDGIFYPCRFYNSLAAFTAKKIADKVLFDEDDGYAVNPVYRNENRDAAFDLPAKDIVPFIDNGTSRYASGCKYFNKSDDSQDDYSVIPENESEIYNPEEALAQVQKDAEDFITRMNEELDAASKVAVNTDFVSETVVINLDDLRHNWSEGISWIDSLFRMADKADFEFTSCRYLLKNQYNLQKITPYYASNLGAGYGENLLSNKNSWMMRYVMKASERMVDLADRFPTDTGLKARLLDLAAKELMIAQDSGWAKMLDEDISPEYVKKVFTESIHAFTMVFDSLGSNTVSTEWLTNLEAEHPLFPWMNYRIFSKKQ
ncbi:MAG: DUF1957 domain-containing protein [Treponema sp.]|nr:DUF1957 domain-containing protein [Treponema sp.]